MCLPHPGAPPAGNAMKKLDIAPSLWQGMVVMSARKPKKLSDQIRDAVRRSGYSRYRICHETGIDQGAMSHFLAGHRGLSLDSIDRLGEFLAFHIVSTSEKGP